MLSNSIEKQRKRPPFFKFGLAKEMLTIFEILDASRIPTSPLFNNASTSRTCGSVRVRCFISVIMTPHHTTLHRRANENYLPLNQFNSEAWYVSLIVFSWQEINSDSNRPLCGVPMRSMLPMWFVIMELHL